MQRLVTLLLGICLAAAFPVRSDHEVPYYPSFYPQEIRLETVAPGAAAALLQSKRLHAYIGAVPHFTDQVPEHLAFMQSLRSYLVVAFNPASAALHEPAQRCAMALQSFAALARESPESIVHPYPVTPYHADYLQHVDRVEAAKTALRAGAAQTQEAGKRPLAWRASGQVAERLIGSLQTTDSPYWDVMLQEVLISDLVWPPGASVPDRPAPPWAREGWFQAYMLLAPTLHDPAQQQAVAGLYQRLIRGEYSSLVERVDLERQLVAGLTQGCERVVVGYVLQREYYNDDFSEGIENLAYDAQLGFNTPVFLRTVKLKDFLWNGWLKLGTNTPPTAAWNPLGGFSDGPGRLLWGALGDPALLPMPYNASWIPNRTRVDSTLIQNGPEGVAVPRDAVLPQPGSGMLAAVAEGRRSTARVTYRALTAPFHDGTPMTVADLLYPYMLAYRCGAKGEADDTLYDPLVAAATAWLRERLVGVRVLRVDTTVQKFGDLEVAQQVPVVEVYVDYTSADAQQVAALAPPWSSVPWHVLALMEEAVKHGLAAFSYAEAARRGVVWLDLVRTQALHAPLQALVAEFTRQGYRPAALQDTVSAEAARQRWTALQEFARTQGHFLVTNGPYRLSAWSQQAVVLQVVRDLTYPIGLATFNQYAYPPRAVIRAVELDGSRINVTADVEKVEQALRSYHTVREPLKPGVMQGVAQLHAVGRYVVVGPDGVVHRVGNAAWQEDGRFTVDLTAAGLSAGLYTVVVAIYPNHNALNPDIRRLQYAVR
jgi:hypothetical protein